MFIKISSVMYFIRASDTTHRKNKLGNLLGTLLPQEAAFMRLLYTLQARFLFRVKNLKLKSIFIHN